MRSMAGWHAGASCCFLWRCHRRLVVEALAWSGRPAQRLPHPAVGGVSSGLVKASGSLSDNEEHRRALVTASSAGLLPWRMDE